MRKKALITGAAKGLGRATAIKFASEGYDVILTYLNSEQEALKLKDELESEYSVDVTAVKVNLLSDDDIEKLIENIDRLDVLINNAAYNYDCDLFEKTSSTFGDILRVNLIAPFILAQKLYPVLKANNGTIINVASTNGIDTLYPESLDYDASKAGLINLTKNLAIAFDSEVRVLAIAPDWIETEALSDMGPEFRRREEERLGSFSKPEEVAETIKEMVDDTLIISGTVKRIDGGESR